MIKFTIINEFRKAYKIDEAIDKSLIQSVELVRGKAVKNAPYQTGNLRRSITTDIKNDDGIIGTNVKYAKAREYSNKKNPHRKFYMKRALESSKHQIMRIFTKNINNVLNNK